MIAISSMGLIDVEDFIYLLNLANRVRDLPSAVERIQNGRTLAVMTYASNHGLPVDSRLEEKYENLEKILTEHYDLFRFEAELDGNGGGIYDIIF